MDVAPVPAPGHVAAGPARAPDHVLAARPARAPGPLPDLYLPPAGPDRIVPFLPDALQPEPFFQANDKWLIPLVAVAAAGAFLAVIGAAYRWVRQLGVPIRG